MFEKKFKDALLKKIGMQQEVWRKIYKIQKENPDMDLDELDETNDEFVECFKRLTSLSEEIDELLIDTKFFPLCGLSPGQLRAVPDGPKFLPKVRRSDGSMIDGGVLGGAELIEKYLDLELIKNKEEMKRRVGQLKTLKTDFEIDFWTRFLYKQAALTYTYGLFESCCILCRAIIESIAKKYIESKGCEDLLVGKDKEKKQMSIIGILRKLNIAKDTINLYSKICGKADSILHQRNKHAFEEDALSCIESLQLFFKKFPKMV